MLKNFPAISKKIFCGTAAVLLFGLQATPSWALSQTCSAPNVQQSFTNSDPAGTKTGTIQSFTIPTGVTSITINAAGAEGGTGFNGPGGKGAEVAATVPVTPAQALCVVVGTRGGNGVFGGGGGGSFVYRIASGTCASNLSAVTAGNTAPNLIMAAAGGGAGGGNNDGIGLPGRATGLASGAAGALAGDKGRSTDPGVSEGGTGGNGGGNGNGPGGGGLLSDGGTYLFNASCRGGQALINGAAGGGPGPCAGSDGGFGGGGSSGGGGGGYNGGGGSTNGGGGGGSFSIATPIFAQDGQQAGNGVVSVCYAVPTTTTTALISSVNPSRAGQTITFTATVSAQSGTPTGTVTFKDGSTTLATKTLASGQATLATDALKPGAHPIVATYNGGGGFAASNSPMLQQNVNPHVGAEFRVNTTTAGSQQQPAIARLAGDGFAVVWTSSAGGDAAPDIFAQRYRKTGVKAGGQFRINVTAMKASTRPAVSGLADGGFVAVWQSDGTSAPRTGTRGRGGSGGSGAIVGQRFNKNGAKTGGEFEVGPAAAGQLAEPAVAGLANGGFAAVWNLGEGPGVVGRVFNAAGSQQGQDIRVTPANAKDPAQPAIAALSGGGFVVAWQEGAASNRSIAGQRVTATGANEGAVIRFGTGARSAPALAGLSDGGFAAAWQSAPGDGSGLGIFAERYGSNGARTSAAFRVNTMRTNDQWEPVVSGFANGGFMVAWTSSGQDGSGNGVYAQGYVTSAAPVFSEFRANTTVAQNQWQPAIAAFSSGQLVTAWTSANQDGAREGVYGQRFDLMGLTGE